MVMSMMVVMRVSVLVTMAMGGCRRLVGVAADLHAAAVDSASAFFAHKLIN